MDFAKMDLGKHRRTLAVFDDLKKRGTFGAHNGFVLRGACLTQLDLDQLELDHNFVAQASPTCP